MEGVETTSILRFIKEVVISPTRVIRWELDNPYFIGDTKSTKKITKFGKKSCKRLACFKYFLYVSTVRLRDMKVKDLKKLLENMNEDLPVVFKVDGFNFREVETGKISYIRRKVILE